MTDVNLSDVVGGGSGSGYDAVALQMISQAVNAASIEDAWKLADRREVFDRLVFNLDAVEITNKTADAAFDSAADALAFASSSALRDRYSASSYLSGIGETSAELVNYFAGIVSDVSTASYDSVSLSVSAQDGTIQGIAFSADGTKLFMAGSGNDAIYQYSLTTAWDLSTASYDSVSLSVSAQDGSPEGIAFSSGGTKLFMVGSGNDAIYQYSLTTAWDLSTASYDSVSLSVSAQDIDATGIAFSADGTKLFMVGFDSDAIYQYSLTTAWDLSTASYDSVSLSVSAQDGISTGIAFSADGTKLFMVGLSSDAIYQYSLTTAWDLSTASYDSVSLSVGAQDVNPKGIAFSADGTKLFMAGGNGNAVYQYSGVTASAPTFLVAP